MKRYLKLLILPIATSLSAQLAVAVLDFEGIGVSDDESKDNYLNYSIEKQIIEEYKRLNN